MFKVNIENLILIIVFLSAGIFIYRIFLRPPATKHNIVTIYSQNQTSPTPRVHSNATLPKKKIHRPLRPLMTRPAVMATSSSLTSEPLLKRYKELMNNPRGGMERLNLIEQMMEKNVVTPETVAYMAYQEVLNSGPSPNVPPHENVHRREMVMAAFEMYLDQCKDFDSCHKYAIQAFLHHEDPQLIEQLYSSFNVRYDETWQQRAIEEELQKYMPGL